MNSSIAVLIPAFNEEKTIEKVVLDFLNVFQKEDFKIYVYDNNSKDASFEIVEKLQKQNQDKIILKKEPKKGKGNVVKRMFKEVDADFYILVDGDDTYPHEQALDIVKMLKEKKCDMVVADRLSANFFEVNKRCFHSFGNKLINKLINFLFKPSNEEEIKDATSGYRAFNRNFVKNINLSAEGFEVEAEMTILALKNKFKIIEIPMNYKNRPKGSKSKLNTYLDGFIILRTIFYYYIVKLLKG